MDAEASPHGWVDGVLYSSKPLSELAAFIE